MFRGGVQCNSYTAVVDSRLYFNGYMMLVTNSFDCLELWPDMFLWYKFGINFAQILHKNTLKTQPSETSLYDQANNNKITIVLEWIHLQSKKDLISVIEHHIQCEECQTHKWLFFATF